MIRGIRSPSASLMAFRDGIGPIHFRPGPDTSRQASRFVEFQHGLIRGDIKSDEPLVGAALALVAFEAILTPGELAQALLAVPAAYQHDGRMVLEWFRANRWQDRRYLSPLTSACLASGFGMCLPGAEKRAIAKAAELVFPGADGAIDLLFSCACSWAYENLPGVLLGHVTGLAPFCAVPQSALARLATGLALTCVAPDEVGADEAVGAALDRFFNGPDQTGSAWAIDALVKGCTFNSTISDARNRRDMLFECQTISSKIGEVDPLSALIVAWAADLIESGTITKIDIRPTTIQTYVRCIAMPLHLSASRTDILQWSVEEYQECYQKIVGAATDGKQGNTASALSSWHHFLVRFLDAPPLRVKLHAQVEESVPAANVIWPGEKLRISEWISFAAGDDRLIGQVKFGVEVCWCGRLRAKELFQLRMHNIRFYPGAVEIEVAPMIRDGRTKSPSGRRVITYSDPAAQAVIRQWHCRRIEEGALTSDYVFGDPYEPEKIYRLGSLYVMLNQLSKAATGDPSVSLHTWGHSRVSFEVDHALITPAPTDVEPLDEVATVVGHSMNSTSIRHYAHLFERALRNHVDRALRYPKLTSTRAAELSGVSAVALRQRSFAQKRPAQDVYRAAINEQLLPPDLLPVSGKFTMAEPMSPLDQTGVAPAKFDDVLAAINDISRGLDVKAVGLRSRRSPEWVTSLNNAMLRVLSRLGVQTGRYADPTLAPLDISVQLLTLPRNAFDFSRIGQTKFTTLRTELGRLDPMASRSFATAWEYCYSGHFLSLQDAHTAGRLFGHLATSGIPADHLALSIASSTAPKPDNEALALESVLQLGFRSAFHLNAKVEWKLPRRGRPSRYLIWSSLPLKVDTSPASASLSVAGFNSLMLALDTLLELESHST